MSNEAARDGGCQVPKTLAQEAYIQHVSKVMDAAGWPWPRELVLNPTKLPHFVDSVDEFLKVLQFGDHMDKIIVFPDGLRKLGQDAALHPALRKVVRDGVALTGYDVLDELSSQGVLNEWKGAVAYLDTRDPSNRKESHAQGNRNGRLSDKFDDLKKKCPQDARTSVYLSEIRSHAYSGAAIVPGLHSNRKSTLQCTMRERASELGMNVQNMLYWDDFSEGVFISGGGAGFDLHQDCIQTSNVGSVFSGHKLLAIWSYPADTRAVLSDHYGTNLVPPLLESQAKALTGACAIALAPPGSVYIFSGCNAHAVCNIGFDLASDGGSVKPSLCVSSYEAFANLHETHALALARTHDEQFHYKKTWMKGRADLREFHEDVAQFLRNCMGQVSVSQEGEQQRALRAIDTVLRNCPRIEAYIQKLERKERSSGKRSSSNSTGSTSASTTSSTRAAGKKRKRLQSQHT
eukprot:TRINITY_DN34057_c0_g1_i1.p1 TRINITY_DN34057_c0_g1~~TRINITY_DN34057_c0_g1_i1.p1  ORF type:complete len:461 (+),score=72.44 TRINITY_DN34057_c0_g1_i1:68-1450(+)